MLPLLLPPFLPHVPLCSVGRVLLWVKSFWKLLGVAIPTCWRREENPKKELFLRPQEAACPCWLPSHSNEAYLGAQDMFITHYMHHLGDLFMPKKKWGQAQENGSCDLWMHAQLLGLKDSCPQQLWAKPSKAETGEVLKQPSSTATGFSLADPAGSLRSLLSKCARTKNLCWLDPWLEWTGCRKKTILIFIML